MLAVQQESNALNPFAPQLAEVIAQVMRDLQYRLPRRVRESGLVLQRARNRGWRQTCTLGDVANGDRTGNGYEGHGSLGGSSLGCPEVCT